ncbi:hypothetical protein [Acinetobacter colistiniresistens]|uniref:hypothetical protein n=1 Tax=Acinetobacter colistiniresistens TaxID=280145 RepID=UPI001250717C|nr:hypothetical protein [Acinetobacter colistiniresistens]
MKQPTYEQFQEDVKDHVLTVNLDNELYRDITIKKPHSVDMHYHITTRPGYLMFTGDMGCYVFERTPDMFRFFRGCKINPYYWSEKLQAGKYQEYSPEMARKALDNVFENWKECTDKDEEFIENEKSELDGIDTDNEFEFTSAVNDHYANEGGVDLTDFWEYNVKDYTYHYIWCCYAIVHAIDLYDQHKIDLQDGHKEEVTHG